MRGFYATIPVVSKLADIRNLQIAALVATLFLGAFVVFGSPPTWLIAITLLTFVITVLLTYRTDRTQPVHETPLENSPEAAEHAIIESLDQAIIICTSEGVVKLRNTAAKQLFRATSLMGKNLRHIAMSEDLVATIDDALRSDSKIPISREYSVDYPEPRSLRVRAIRVGDDVALMIADVSDIRRLETVRSDFVANVSHELRTPMASIRAMAETIEDDPEITLSERNAYLVKIVEEVDRLTLLSEDLLTLAAAETTPTERGEIDHAEIARYAVQQFEQPAAAKGLALHLEAPRSQPALGDAPQVIQVALNLLQNAIRYTNAGEIHVRVYEDGEDAVLEVADTGIGIGKEHLPRIFERFYRVDAARSRATGGTGLGLAIVRHITEGLGGRVEVDSELGKGSTFRVRLHL
jgi:two-component system phosphate regulon sensor histidine kinase PhoR